MSSSKTSTGINSINIFTGIDYHVWAERMKSYLLHIGSWSIINLSFPKPSPPTDTTTAAIIPEYRKELHKWQKLNDSGLGALHLKVSDSIRWHIATEKSVAAWTTLQISYNKTTPALIFDRFQKTVKFQLSGKDPVPEIERLGSYFAQLTEDKVIIPDFMQALILAAALPKEWTAISTAMFQLYGTEKVTFEAISNSIIREWWKELYYETTALF